MKPNLLSALIVCFGLAASQASGFAAKQKSPSVQQCFGELQKTIPFAWEKPCAKLAKSHKTTKRDRAKILFQLGHAMQEHANEHQLSFRDAAIKAFAIWDDAIAVDPTFIEPYITIAYRWHKAAQLDALAYLDRALAHAPNNAMLIALKASTRASVQSSQTTREESGLLCESALKLAPADVNVAGQCAEVLGTLKRNDEQLILLRKVAENYSIGERRLWGLFQESNPWLKIAFVQNKMGLPKEAAATLTTYFSQPNVTAMTDDIQMRANYHEAAGEFREAAADFGRIAIDLNYPTPQKARVRQIINLIRAGDDVEARELSRDAFSKENLRAVLQLQVRLKNTDFPDLEINGNFDEATREALEQCIRSESCAEGVAGQKI